MHAFPFFSTQFCPVGCPYCRRNLEGGLPCYAGIGYCPERLERWRNAMDERLRLKGKANDGVGAKVAPSDSEFEKKYPALWAFLTDDKWSSGDSRETGSVLLFSQEGCWKAMIKDKDSGYIAFVTKNTFKTLLEALERGLVEEKLDWREDAFKSKKKGKG